MSHSGHTLSPVTDQQNNLACIHQDGLASIQQDGLANNRLDGLADSPQDGLADSPASTISNSQYNYQLNCFANASGGPPTYATPPTPASSPTWPCKTQLKYYSVTVGRRCGVFTRW